MEGIVSSLIVGGLSLIGVIVTCIMTSKKSETVIKINQAITDTKIDNLTHEVQKHNHFAERMPVVEEQIKVINHRIDDLERKNGQ